MDYEPAFYCKCKRGNRRDGFPGAFRSLKGGTMHACDAGWGDAISGKWHDDNSTTPFVKQLLIDLRDRVLEFGKKENAELRDSISDARAQMEQHIGEKISFEGNG